MVVPIVSPRLKPNGRQVVKGRIPIFSPGSRPLRRSTSIRNTLGVAIERKYVRYSASQEHEVPAQMDESSDWIVFYSCVWKSLRANLAA